MDGQSEYTIKVLKDMLRAYVSYFGGIGASFFHKRSSPTMLVTIPAFKWHYLRLCIGESVDIQFDDRKFRYPVR